MASNFLTILRCTAFLYTILELLVLDLEGSLVNGVHLLPRDNKTAGYGVIDLFSSSLATKAEYSNTWFPDLLSKYQRGIYFTSSAHDICDNVEEISVKTSTEPSNYDNSTEMKFCSGNEESDFGFLVKFNNSVGFRLHIRASRNKNMIKLSSAGVLQIYWMLWSKDEGLDCEGVLCSTPKNFKDNGYICIDPKWQCDITDLKMCEHIFQCLDDDMKHTPAIMIALKYTGLGIGVIVVCVCCWFCVRTAVQDMGEHGHTLGMFHISWVTNTLRQGRHTTLKPIPKTGSIKRDSLRRTSFQKTTFQELSQDI